MGSRSPHVKRQFWGWKEPSPGHARTCQMVDILKVTQQGAVLIWCRCRFGWTLVLSGKYNWTIHVQWWRSLSSSYFNHLFLSGCIAILHRREPNVTDRVVWSVCHECEVRKIGWTDRNAIWSVDSGGPKVLCIGSGYRYPDRKEHF